MEAQNQQSAFNVSVPPGTAEGATLLVTAPNGLQVNIKVPIGFQQGTMLEIPMPQQKVTAPVTAPVQVMPVSKRLSADI